MPVLCVEGLSVRYGDRVAVRDVSFAVSPGEVFALIGPNGAGKTSTLAAIEGLRVPSAGRIRICDVDARREPRAARACLGVQLQTTAFQPDLTLLELVRLYAGLYGARLGAREARRRLEEAGLGAEADRRAPQLSVGQRQRLSLLVATLHDPALTVLDEPTTGLDPRSRREIWQHIGSLRKEGRSVLLTTHSMEEAAHLGDRIGILVNGTLVAVDTPQALVQRHARDLRVQKLAHGPVTLEDVFLALSDGEGGQR